MLAPARTSGLNFEELLEGVGDAIVIASRAGTIVYVNASTERLLATPRASLVGQLLTTIIPERMRGAHGAGFARFVETGVRHLVGGPPVRVPARRGDGVEVEVELSLSEVAMAGGESVLVASIRDLSERLGLQRAEQDKAAAEAATEQLVRVQRVTEALSESLTKDAVADVILRHAADSLDADICTLHLVSADDTKLVLTGTPRGVAEGVVDRIREIDTTDPKNTAARALRERAGLCAEDETAYHALFPELAGVETTGTRAKAFLCAPLLSGTRSIGVIGMGFYAPRRFSLADRAFLETIARQCALALERTRLLTEARENERRLGFLAEASTVLAGSLDYEDTIASVTRLAVPTVADWAAVDIAEQGGTFKRIAIAHVDERKIELARELDRRWPPRQEDPTGLANVVRTGVAELVSVISDEMLAAAIDDPDRLAAARSLGLASWMCVPLKMRERTIGAITFGSAESGRRFGPADLALAEDLAVRAGIAIENATSFREADEANRMKDEFLATMSHELRTPLGAILGWASMLQTDKRDDPGAIDRGLSAIERNARAQVKLIEDVLDVSRIITGKLRIEPRAVDVGAVVSAAMDVVRPMAAAKGVSILGLIAPEPLPTFGDPDRIQQILWNLMSNAVKFTPKGGTVEVAVERKGATIRIAVTDSGEGIKPQFLPFIFERFRQADGSTTRRHGGLGLGLAIARHLVELHGGTIRVDSEGEGRGASFTVTLPMRVVQLRAIEATAPPAEERPSAAPSAPPSLRGLRVLICDDDPETREMLVMVLIGAGAEVREAGSAFEALEQLGPFAPDVLVSDIGMPQVDGYSFMRKVRSLPDAAGGRTPALALTAYAQADDERRALASGFQMHVAKPADPRDLIERVANLGGRITEV